MWRKLSPVLSCSQGVSSTCSNGDSPQTRRDRTW
jgi:hypothetical protein